MSDVAKTQTKSFARRQTREKNIVAIVFANDFVQGGSVHLFRDLIGHTLTFLAITFFIFAVHFFCQIALFLIIFYVLFN